MPTVPSYQRQVQETATPNVRVNDQASLESFGGGQVAQQANQGVQGLTADIHKIAEEEKKKADTTIVQDGWTKLVEAKNALIYDPKTGAFTRKGRDAANIAEEYGIEFDKQADKLEESLSSQDQKDMFRHIKQREKLEFTEKLQKHAYGEQEAFADETAMATVKTGKDEAVLNYMDNAKVDQSLGLVKATIMEQADRKGWSPETTKMHMDAEVSSARAAIIGRHLDNGDDLTAKKYYDEHKDELTGQDAAHLEKALEEGSLRGESQRQSDAITAKRLSFSGAISEVKKIADPKVRDATMERVKGEYALQEAAKRDADEKTFLYATNIIEKGGGYDKIPPGIIANLPLSHRTALRSYANKEEGPSDLATIYDLKMQAATPELRAKFMSTDILAVKNLNTKDKLAFIELQADEKRRAGALDDKLSGFQSAQQVVDEQLSVAGIDPHPKYLKSAKVQVAEYHAAVEKKMIDFEKLHGKKPTNVELKQIADETLIKKTREGSGFLGFGKDTRHDFEIKPQQITPDERAAIETSLRAARVPVTEATIFEAYKRRYKQDK